MYEETNEDTMMNESANTNSAPSPSKFQKIQLRLIPALNIIGFILVIIVNALGAAGILNNIPTGKVSDEYETPLTPAGYAFSIWGLIYTFIALVIVINTVQSLIMGRNNELLNEKISILLPVNFLFNCLWMFAWQYSARGNIGLLWLSLVFMFGILASLILMYLRVNVHYYEPSKKENSKPTIQGNSILAKFVNSFTMTRKCNFWEYWIVQPMISLYMGWISVATTINIAITLTTHFSTTESNIYERSLWGVSNVIWTCVLEGVIVCLGIIFLHWKRDFVFASVFSWALFAVSVKQKANQVVSVCSAVCASIIIFFVLYTIVLTLVDYIQCYGGIKGTWKQIRKNVKKSFTKN